MEQIRVERINKAEDVEPLVRLFEQIADEESWSTRGQLRRHSLVDSHIALRVSGVLAGGIQIVRQRPTNRMPCLDVWPELSPMLDGQINVANVTVFAIDRPYRRQASDLMWTLCVELFKYCLEAGVETIVAEVTPLRLRQYVRIGLPFEVIGRLRPHWGELAHLVSMRVGAAEREISRRSLTSAKYKNILARALATTGSAASLQSDYR